MDLSNTLISAEVLLNTVPPIRRHHRLPRVDGSCSGVSGISDRHHYPWHESFHGSENCSKEELQGLQEGLLDKALKLGTDKWDVISDPSLGCPCCGFDNLHQETVVDDGKQSESFGVAYSCETCPATPHLQLLQHKGISYLFWDAQQLLEDFGVYTLAEALINDKERQIKSAVGLK